MHRSSLLLLSFLALTTGSVIRKDYMFNDEAESNNGREGVVDGDIMLTDEQKKELGMDGKRAKRQISTVWKKWPNKVVYYGFDDDFATIKRSLMRSAMDYITSKTCVTFVENATATNRLEFVNTVGCASYIGMNGGVQKLWFADGCEVFGTAVHELMHTLGIFHTHSRYDRNDYLTVNLTNVPSNMVGNLAMETPATTFNAVPFEYGSTMMYRANTWGDGNIEPKNMDYERTMGTRKVSFYDMVNVNVGYACTCPQNLTCLNGGYTNPADCSSCICPPGYGGKLCGGTPSSTVSLTASSSWKGYYVQFGYSTQTLTTNFYTANIVISAPADKTIQVMLVGLDNFICTDGCNYNGVEVKVMGDPRIMNPLFCCADDDGVLNTVMTGKLNPMPLVLHQRYGNSKVSINYRYIDKNLSDNEKTTNGYDSYEYYA